MLRVHWVLLKRECKRMINVTNAKGKTQNVKLLLIVVCYLALATTYSVVTPLGEGPDEPGHAAYVFFLAQTGRLPDQRANEVPGEGHQPPLAYLLALPAALWLPAAERRYEQPGNLRFVWAGGAQPNAVAHGTSEFWPWRGPVLAWHLMRMFSVACGGATVALTYALAKALQRAERRATIRSWQSAIPLLAASLVAFNPQFLFIGGLVNNDALLAALCALTLWLCVHGSLQRGPWHAAALGAVLGAALLTKQSALVLVPVIVLAGGWGLATGVSGLPSSPAPQRREWQVRNLLITFGVAALVCGWWFVRNWQIYGDPLGLAAFQAEFQTQAFDSTNVAAWQAGLGQLFSSYWARFGWMNVSPPVALLWAFAGLVTLSIFGWIAAVRRISQRGLVLALVLIATTFVWLILFARTAGLVAWQGRLLFPAASAIAVVLAFGLAGAVSALERRVALPQSAWLLLPTGMAALALWLPFGVIRPAYPPQTLTETVALARPLTAVHVRFVPTDEPGAELRGWALVGPAQASATLELTLLWHALGRQRHDWTVFVHLVDPQGKTVFADNRQPRAGAFPTGQWNTGDWIEDIRTFTLPPTLAPGTYHIQIGMYNAEGTLERLGVQNAAGEPIGDSIDLGAVSVVK